VAKLQRTTFKTSRAAQYVEARALQAMTGQSRGHFADVVVKENMDDAVDACETAGAPHGGRGGSSDPPSLREAGASNTRKL
jgi:hypothetical protein